MMMNRSSPFKLEFIDDDRDDKRVRISITAGDLNVVSYPQSIRSHLRDLIANRHFFAKKMLREFFFGDEPVCVIDYLKRDLIQAYAFEKKGFINRRTAGFFLHRDALFSIDKFIEDVCNNQKNSFLVDKKSLLGDVARDIHIGVYDVYLNRGSDV